MARQSQPPGLHYLGWIDKLELWPYTRCWKSLMIIFMSIRLDTIQYHNITEQTGASGGRAEMLDTQKWALSAFTGIEVNS